MTNIFQVSYFPIWFHEPLGDWKNSKTWEENTGHIVRGKHSKTSLLGTTKYLLSGNSSFISFIKGSKKTQNKFLSIVINN